MSRRDVDPLIMSFQHEAHRPREKDALLTLKKIASLVKPLMRARGWRVGTLSEFYPEQTNLLGLNVNRGAKICLRLRHSNDATLFLPIEDITDTMLHELAHNVFGPHDEKFHALWNQLREEHEGLLRKGYTGEGFLSTGKRLGGSTVVPRDEARRIARAAAEKRRMLTSGSGQKLGGVPLRAGQDIRQVIVNAIERRARITKGCGATDHSAEEIKEIADRSTASGFKTKAEEDKANDEAIAQALWELIQEEEQEKYGKSYIPPSQANPTGNGGAVISPEKVLNGVPATSSPPHKRTKRNEVQTSHRPLSRLISPKLPESSSSSSNPSTKERDPPARSVLRPPRIEDKSLPLFTTELQPISQPSTTKPYKENIKLSQTKRPLQWICPVCTCHNPETFLCCDACTSTRPPMEKREMIHENGDKPASEPPSSVKNPEPKTWFCHGCGNEMDVQWWTCNVCDTMKLSS